jgi:hypothetical protein
LGSSLIGRRNLAGHDRGLLSFWPQPPAPGTIAPPTPKNNSNESNRKRQYSGALTGIAVQVVAIYWRI